MGRYLQNSRLNRYRYGLASFLLLLIVSCSPPVQKTNPLTQTPAFQWFLKGRQFLKQNELIQAEIAFNRALDFKRNFAPALDGLAQVYLAQNHTELAEQYLQLALQGKPRYLPTRLTEIRLLIRNGEFELANEKLRTLNRLVFAKKLKLLYEPVSYYSALIAFEQNRFNEAQKYLDKLLKINPQNRQGLKLRARLNRQLQVLKQFPEAVRPFILKPVITRMEIVQLVEYYFGDVQYAYPLPAFITDLYPKLSAEQISDIDRHSVQARQVINALNNQLIWAYPDGKFRPQDPVRRGEMALILQRIYFRLHGAELPKNYSCSFDDVPEEDFIFPAACLAIEHHWMDMKGGAFLPQDNVNGFQAARALQKLKKENSLH